MMLIITASNDTIFRHLGLGCWMIFVGVIDFRIIYIKMQMPRRRHASHALRTSTSHAPMHAPSPHRQCAKSIRIAIYFSRLTLYYEDAFRISRIAGRGRFWALIDDYAYLMVISGTILLAVLLGDNSRLRAPPASGHAARHDITLIWHCNFKALKKRYISFLKKMSRGRRLISIYIRATTIRYL